MLCFFTTPMRTAFLEETADVRSVAQQLAPGIPRAAFQTGKLLGTWVACVAPALFAHSHQYTWSLLIFVVPMLVLAHELWAVGALMPLLQPLGWALALLVPMGGVLTVGLADDFFIYPATSSTLGITMPALDVTGIDRAFQIPIEELAFYVLGFTSLLVFYAWADAILLPQTRVVRSRPNVSLPEFLLAVGGGVALCAAGWAVQRSVNPAGEMPGYWMYLMLVPVPMMVAVGPSVASRINWPALALVSLALWGHSVLWEVTLAIPQGWWGYQPQAMLGLSISAWHELPLEAVVVWLITPLATVICFEALRAQLSPFPKRRAS